MDELDVMPLDDHVPTTPLGDDVDQVSHLHIDAAEQLATGDNHEVQIH